MRSRLKGIMPPQLSYASQLGLFLTLTVPGVMPLVPGKVLALRTFRVEWHFEHLTSSKATLRDRAGNVFLVLPGIAGSGMSLPIAGTASRTISWKRKFLSAASHCMYSTAFGCEP